jgi:hypothetical protein
MAGIIINIPPIIPIPPINPTSSLMPVRDGDTFVDSNFVNIIDDNLRSEVLGDEKGLKLDFTNDSYAIGNPNSLQVTFNANVQQIQIIGDVIADGITVIPDKFLNLQIQGAEYYILLNVIAP